MVGLRSAGLLLPQPPRHWRLPARPGLPLPACLPPHWSWLVATVIAQPLSLPVSILPHCLPHCHSPLGTESFVISSSCLSPPVSSPSTWWQVGEGEGRMFGWSLSGNVSQWAECQWGMGWGQGKACHYHRHYQPSALPPPPPYFSGVG